MHRYKIVANLISGKCEPAIDPFGPLVRYEDAAEQVKKARRETLDEVIALIDSLSISSEEGASLIEQEVRELMDEEG